MSLWSRASDSPKRTPVRMAFFPGRLWTRRSMGAIFNLRVHQRKRLWGGVALADDLDPEALLGAGAGGVDVDPGVEPLHRLQEGQGLGVEGGDLQPRVGVDHVDLHGLPLALPPLQGEDGGGGGVLAPRVGEDKGLGPLDEGGPRARSARSVASLRSKDPKGSPIPAASASRETCIASSFKHPELCPSRLGRVFQQRSVLGSPHGAMLMVGNWFINTLQRRLGPRGAIVRGLLYFRSSDILKT